MSIFGKRNFINERGKEKQEVEKKKKNANSKKL